MMSVAYSRTVEQAPSPNEIPRIIRYVIAGLGLVLSIFANTSAQTVPIQVLQPDAGIYNLGDSITVRWVYTRRLSVQIMISVNSGLTYDTRLSDAKYFMSSDTGTVRLVIPFDPSLVSDSVVLMVESYNLPDDRGYSPVVKIRNPSTIKWKPEQFSRIGPGRRFGSDAFLINGRNAKSAGKTHGTHQILIEHSLTRGSLFVRDLLTNR